MKRLFIIGWSVVVILVATLGVIAVTSLIPYFDIVGKMMVAVVGVTIICICVLLISFTKSRVSIWHNQERLIKAGDVVAWINSNGVLENLSAQNYRAQFAPNVTVRQIAPPAQIEQDTSSDEETVRDLIMGGTSLKSITESTGWTYYRVQKLYASMKESGEI